MTSAMGFAGTVAGIVIAGCALFGWGRLVRRGAGLPAGSWPLTAALGLAAVIFLGGLLNLVRLAYPSALDAVVAIGLALALYEWRKDGLRRGLAIWWPAASSERVFALASYAIVLPVMSFTIATEASPRLYNLADDFRKYFAHAVRMIETGTLAGSPFNALGSETLGAQAFLQGFIIGHFPISFINGADRLFCFALCLMLAGGVARGRPSLSPAALFGVLALVFIDPQFVNVSSLYSSVVLFMALVVLNADPREAEPGSAGAGRRALPSGLIAAAVIALKPTGLLFLGLQLAIATAGAIAIERRLLGPLRAMLVTSLWSLAFLLPWLLLYAPDYLRGLTHPQPGLPVPLPTVTEDIHLFSTARLFYGASSLAYTLLAAALAAYALLCALSRRAPRTAPPRLYAINLAAACAAAAISYVAMNTLGLRSVEAAGALRYSIPTLIGVTPVALSLAVLHLDDRTRLRGARRGSVLATLFGIAIIGMFAASALERAELLFQDGSELAFLPTAQRPAVDYMHHFEDNALPGPLGEEVAYFQAKIPAGEPVLAWNEAPFLLDFKRNPVLDVNESGLAPPWSQVAIPHYVLWQAGGYAIPQRDDYLAQILVGRRMGEVAVRALEFRRNLATLYKEADILAEEDGTVVMKLKDAGQP